MKENKEVKRWASGVKGVLLALLMAVSAVSAVPAAAKAALIEQPRVATAANTSGVYGRISSPINFRTGAGSDASVICRIYPGTRVKVLRKIDNNWFQIEHKGTRGYVSSSYLSVEGNPLPVGHLTAQVKLYASPSYAADSLKTMASGSLMMVLARTSSAWTKIRHNGQVGYIPTIYWADLRRNIAILPRLSTSKLSSKSVLLMNITDNKLILNHNGGSSVLPASLIKLFSIRYALTKTDLSDLVTVRQAELNMTSGAGSSAGLRPGTYYVRNLIEAMLVPSGNDASYALARHVGRKILGPGYSTKEYVEAFLKGMRGYLKDQGYRVTRPTDPSGDSYTDRSTAWEVYRVANDLMARSWFRAIVRKEYYTATFPNGSTKTWRNSNHFLRSSSMYYDPSVIGVKTGSYYLLNNLCSHFRHDGKNYIMVSMASTVENGRYEDGRLIKRIIQAQ